MTSKKVVKKKTVPARGPRRAAPGIRVWMWYYPDQLDQIGRPGPFGGVYKEKPERNEYSKNATLITGIMREVRAKRK
jgi:hypothetical protein